MQKIIRLFSLILVVLFMTGCLDYKIGFNINNDQSLDLSMLVEVDMLKFMNNMFQNEELKDAFLEQSARTACEYTCDALDEDCMTKCIAENKPTTITDEDIRNYLAESLENGEISGEDFFSEDSKAKLEEKGFLVTSTLDQENYIYTASITKHYASIDDVSTSEKITPEINELVNGTGEELYFTKTASGTYQANFIIGDTSLESSDFTDFSLNDINLEDYMTYTYTVTLPTPALSSNASSTSTDKKTLTWNLTSNTLDKISYEFSFPSNTEPEKNSSSAPTYTATSSNNDTLKYLSYGLIGGGSITALITTLIFIKSHKKNKSL